MPPPAGPSPPHALAMVQCSIQFTCKQFICERFTSKRFTRKSLASWAIRKQLPKLPMIARQCSKHRNKSFGSFGQYWQSFFSRRRSNCGSPNFPSVTVYVTLFRFLKVRIINDNNTQKPRFLLRRRHFSIGNRTLATPPIHYLKTRQIAQLGNTNRNKKLQQNV